MTTNSWAHPLKIITNGANKERRGLTEIPELDSRLGFVVPPSRYALIPYIA